MDINELLGKLLDRTLRHPGIAVTSLIAFLLVSGIAAVFYIKITEARIELLEKKAENAEKREKRNKEDQHRVNRVVQKQFSDLETSLDRLSPSVFAIQKIVKNPSVVRNLSSNDKDSIDGHMNIISESLTLLRMAINNSNTHIRYMDDLASGINAEKEGRLADAAAHYAVAANGGVPEAQTRLARLYFAGLGVEKNVGLGRRLLERSALLGDEFAKIEIILQSKPQAQDQSGFSYIDTAALLKINPQTLIQELVAEKITEDLSEEEKNLVLLKVRALKAERRKLVWDDNFGDSLPEQ